MRTFPTSALLGGAALAFAAVLAGGAAPATGQDKPELILPPGFGEPAPSPRPTAQPNAPTPPAVTGTATVQPLPTASASPSPVPGEPPTAGPTPTPTPIDPEVLAQYEMPASARRSLAVVGPTGVREGGLGPAAFGNADGQYLETLMRRLSAPLPSRWISILVRRTLASRLTTPRNVNGADFAAERGWLLLRMGESVAARAVVQSVDADNYTPKLYQVAMNAALATGDPAGMCPLADAGMRATAERGWMMAQAMCTALSGDATKGGALINAARRRGVASGIDFQLAQKVVGAGGQGRQAVTIEWAGIDQLTVWRIGLAIATGVAIPDTLLSAVGPQVSYWRALAPAVPLGERIGAAELAAGQGVLSSAALVDLYGAIDAAEDSGNGEADATAQDLRTAYVGNGADPRLAALRQLWGEAGKRPVYSRLVLTAHAAARVRPADGKADADQLIASMLSAGLDRTAARWRGSVESGSDAWAMLAVADPDARARVTYRDLASYSGGGNAALKQRMLFAGLAGLGRLGVDDTQRASQALDVRIGTENAWTRALDRAARAGEPGTVALLAAIGMQTSDWRGVPPEALYRIVGALRAVGLEGEARMIAAEAIARA